MKIYRNQNSMTTKTAESRQKQDVTKNRHSRGLQTQTGARAGLDSTIYGRKG